MDFLFASKKPIFYLCFCHNLSKMQGVNNIIPMNNLPNGKEAPKKAPAKQQNIYSLLQEGIIREFWSPMNPEKFDAYKSQISSMTEWIRTHMKDLRQENLEDWGDISDEIITTQISDTEIQERVARLGKALVLSRKRAFDRAIELFPQIKKEENYEATLRWYLAQYNQEQLNDAATRTPIMRWWMKRAFPGIIFSPTEARDFEKIFPESEKYLKDDNTRNRFKRMCREYTQHGIIPGSDEIEMILSAYQDAPVEMKKRILSGLGVAISIKTAYEWGLIDDAYLEQFCETEMGDIYSTLEKAQKQSFLRWLQQEETYLIAVWDFQDAWLNGVFKEKKEQRKLVNEVFRSIARDVPKIEETGSDILRDIRRKKQQQSTEQWVEDWDYNLYDAFVEEMVWRLAAKIPSIASLRTEDCVVSFRDPSSGTQFFRIKQDPKADESPIETSDGTRYWVTIEWLATVDGAIIQQQDFVWSFDELAELLTRFADDLKVLKSEEFNELLTKDKDKAGQDGKIYDAREVYAAQEADANNIVEKLNFLDWDGKAFGFDKGTAFIAPSEEEKTGKQTTNDIWFVREINKAKNTVNLMDSNGEELVQNFPIDDLYQALKETPSFKRIARIEDTNAMLKELQKYWLGQDVEIKDGQIFTTSSSSHDTKDGGAHQKPKNISCFKNAEGEHIRLGNLVDGWVYFWEYSSDMSAGEIKKIAAHQKGGITKKEVDGLYTWQTMSYPAFLKYLEEHKFTASEEDLIVPNAHHKHGDGHANHVHMKWSFTKRLMRYQNPASIWKGVKMIFEGIEHTLEKWAKLDAARFAMKAAKVLHLPDSVEAQVYSDIVNASKEIIEKYEKKIFGLPGPKWRWKCIHIVHNKDSRPEEVISAVNFMIKSYGHLYAEDIKHFQSEVTPNNLANAQPGYFAFFDAIVITSKLPGGVYHWRQEAYRKAIEEIGTMEDHEIEPTEEQLIHAMFKLVDGKWETFPYAASVVKATGWPGGFQKTWQIDGYDSAYKKGMEQTSMVSAQWRLNRGMTYLKGYERNKGVGAMEKVAGKIKIPLYQAMPFVWAVWGYSKYASHMSLQELKRYAEQGFSFHAYGFLRNKTNNDIYRQTVRLAVKQMEQNGHPGVLKEFDSYCTRFDNGPESTKDTKEKYGGIDPATGLMNFWQKYQEFWLHDMLQWKNGWLVKMQQDGNETVQKYLEVMVGEGWAHDMALNKPDIPSSDYGQNWYDEHGYQNIILARWENWLNSLRSMLNKIQFGHSSPGAKPMNDDHRNKIWKYVIEHVNHGLRDESYFLWDTSLQEKQYLAYRREIIQYFAEKLSARSIVGSKDADEVIRRNISTFPYYNDLASMGIDPYAVFDESIERNPNKAKEDYNRWKSGSHIVVSQPAKNQTWVPDLRNMIQGKTTNIQSKDPATNDDIHQQAA